MIEELEIFYRQTQRLYLEYRDEIGEDKTLYYTYEEFSVKLKNDCEEFHPDFIDKRRYIDCIIVNNDLCREGFDVEKNGIWSIRVCSFPKNDESDGAIYLILFEDGSWYWLTILKNVDFITHNNFKPTTVKIPSFPEFNSIQIRKNDDLFLIL